MVGLSLGRLLWIFADVEMGLSLWYSHILVPTSLEYLCSCRIFRARNWFPEEPGTVLRNSTGGD